MSRPNFRFSRLSRLAVPVVAGLAVAQAVTAVNATASPVAPAPLPAVSAPASPARHQTADPASSTPASTTPAAQASASARAKATGRPVEVTALTTENTQVMANPAGTFTLTTSREPVRVKQQGSWHSIDPSLKRNADGSLSPVASTLDLRLSAGGGAPLVSFAQGANRIDFSWPTPLPKPAVAGSTATYRSVLPGVDLQVSATGESFTEVLIVKDATAAANPALAALHLSATSPTLALSAASTGGLRATDVHGAEIFHGGTPVMWNSAYNPHLGGKPGPSDPGGARLIPIHLATQVKTALRAAAAGSPGSGSSTDIVLTPPAAALTGKDVQYPLYLDPSMNAVRQNYAWVADNNQHFYDSGTELKVGYCGWDTPVGNACGTPYWTARSYFSLNTTALTGQATTAKIYTVDLHISQTHNAVCDATAAWLLTSGAISSSTTWPGPSGSLIESESSAAGSSCTPNAADMVFNSVNMVNNVQALANADTKSVTYSLSNPYDTSRPARDFWKKFGVNPYMTVVYNFPPSVPTGLTISGAVNCDGANNYVPAGNQTFTASAKDNNPKQDGTPGALQPGLWFEVHPWLDSTNTVLAGNSSAIRIASGATGTYTTQRTGGFPTGIYQAWVQADDQPGSSQDLFSGFSNWYFFNTRSVITQTPAIRSLDYPIGNWGSPHNKAGSFLLDVNGASTAVGFSYSWDSSSTPAVTTCNYNQPALGLAAGTSSTTIVPPSSLKPGRHTLYVRTFDGAHQLSSATGSYTFYISPDLTDSSISTRVEAEQPVAGQSPVVTQPAGQNVPTPTVVDVVRDTNGTDHATVGMQPVPTGYHSDGYFGANYLQFGGMYTTQLAGTHALYDCRIGTDHFTSGLTTCEGQTMVGLIGYAYDSAPSNVPTGPVYRCRTSSEHFDTVFSNCDGATFESILGYVLVTSGRAYSKSEAVLLAATGPDQTFSIPFTAPVTGYYAMGIQLQTGHFGGDLGFTLDGNRAQPLAGTDPANHHGISTDGFAVELYRPLGGQHFTAGDSHTIDITITAAGASTGGYLGIVDFLSLIPLNNITYTSLSDAMNNHGISSDGSTANFDLNGGDSLSLQAMTAAGYGPGGTVTVGSGASAATFTMPRSHPDAQGATVDNVIALGQSIPLPHIKTNKVQMLLTSTCGASVQADSVDSTFTFKEVDDDPFGGNGAPLFQDITLPRVPDWQTVESLSNTPGAPAQISAATTLPYRNGPDGSPSWFADLFVVTFSVDPTHTLDTVTLPNLGSDLLTCTGPTLHVLAMSVGAPLDTVGVYRPAESNFYLRQSDGSSSVINYGSSGDQPLTGDWDGDGTKTVGSYRPSTKTFLLSNSNTTPDVTVTLPWAATGDLPVVGDWDGDGVVTVGVYRPSNSSFYLVNDLSTAATVPAPIGYGTSGDLPVVGDWDGNGTTTIGVYRPSSATFYLNNANSGSRHPDHLRLRDDR